MSLRAETLPPVPEETVRVARAAFPRGNRYLHWRDALGAVYTDTDFADLFPRRGQPAYAPWRLALVCVFQYAEDLSDREAADAVRARLDWKYALSLPLADAGFDASVLTEFRARLVAGDAIHRLLDLLLGTLTQTGLPRAGGRQRTDATAVLAKVRALNRLVLVRTTMRGALCALAVAAPQWLTPHLDPAWAERYDPPWDGARVPAAAGPASDRAAQIGADGLRLLDAVLAPEAPAWLRQVPAVETLRQVWVQQYYAAEPGQAPVWREVADLPPSALRIVSPTDPEARVGAKRDTVWTGYKVHVTETCDDTRPHLLTDVQTTPAPTPDGAVLPQLHARAAAAGQLPAEHLVDTGYVSAPALVDTQHTYGVELVGPVLPDTSWQARRADGFAVALFTINWAQRQVTCPTGRVSTSWTDTRPAHGELVHTVGFAASDCEPCPARAQCTTARRDGRKLTPRPQAAHLALQQARQAQTTPAFKARYAVRAGIEGTLSEGVQVSDLRHARYRGLAKVQLQHVLTACALNLRRLDAWWAGRPFAPTRHAPFVHLLPAAA